MKNGTLETSTGFKFPTDWVGKNVRMILENQVYLGHMVSHKTQTKSFKNKKLVSVPEEEWIIVRNTHEPIIDEETFELVQKFIHVKKQPPQYVCRACEMPGLWTQHGIFKPEWERAPLPLQDLRTEQQSLHHTCDFI